MNKSFLFLLISHEHDISSFISAWQRRKFVPVLGSLPCVEIAVFFNKQLQVYKINVNCEFFNQIYPLFRFDQSFIFSTINCSFFPIIFPYFSKKDSHQRQNELLEGISPTLLELIEKNGEELLFDKGGCQLVLAALLKCAGTIT